jgi:hypothetical protein
MELLVGFRCWRLFLGKQVLQQAVFWLAKGTQALGLHTLLRVTDPRSGGFPPAGNSLLLREFHA